MKPLILILIISTMNLHGISVIKESINKKNLDKFLFNSSLKTDSVIIFNNNKVLLEKYSNGYNKNSRHIMWSVSKSFTSALIGIAIKENKLTLDQSICDFYPQFKKTKKCLIHIDHLLRYTAGLKWSEIYEPSTLIASLSMDKSDVLKMTYGKGFTDTALYTLKRTQVFEPGSTVQYNTGTPNVLMGVLKKIYKDRYEQWVSDSLFKKLDSTNFRWLADKAGNYLGGSHLYTTPRTMLNFGKLYLNNGKFNGEPILTHEWIDYSRTLTKSKKIIEHQDLPGKDIVESTGAMWWLNTPIKGKIPWPDAPLDTFIAWGHWSQFIIIIPSKKTILVRTGLDKTSYFDINQFIKLSLKYIGAQNE